MPWLDGPSPMWDNRGMESLRQLIWVGTAKRDLKGFPAPVQRAMPQRELSLIRTRLRQAEEIDAEGRQGR